MELNGGIRMNFEEFKRKIAVEMKQRIENGEVKIENIVKNNGVNLTGLVMIGQDTNLSPTIYLEPYFEEIQDKSFTQIAEDIWQNYLKNKNSYEVDISQFTEWSKAKDRITVKLINYADNQELLKTIPHEKYLDLAVVYYYLVDICGSGTGTILINNFHLELWGIEKEELHSVAVSNYKKLYRIEVESMQNLLETFLKDMSVDDYVMDDSPVKMYVVTNHLKLYGAAAMLFPEELKKIADNWECDLSIIPSSVHEIIVVPDWQDDVKHMKNMVCEVNESVVDKVEQLSNNVYYYARESGIIQVS